MSDHSRSSSHVLHVDTARNNVLWRRHKLRLWSLTPTPPRVSWPTAMENITMYFEPQTLERGHIQAGKSTWHSVGLYRFNNSGSQSEIWAIQCCLQPYRCFWLQAHQSLCMQPAHLSLLIPKWTWMNELQIALCCSIATSTLFIPSVL